jgi:tetrapyrrole methylase family protein / MazG family protein
VIPVQNKTTIEFAELSKIVSKLRAPDGCPWDREQTHHSLQKFLLSETYEVLEALDEQDYQKLCQELGDLLLQIMLHSQIAEEKGEFNLAEVISGINKKLIRRHPHVFGKVKVEGADAVAHNWEEIKKAERVPGTSILESVPKQMPALAYSQDIQRRVAQIGFDWENTDGVIEKLAEEVKEFNEAVTQAGKEEEFGDLFFTLVNVVRRMGIDPESSLRRANNKFCRRFAHMEQLCFQRGLELDKLSVEEQNKLWDEAKEAVKQGKPDL